MPPVSVPSIVADVESLTIESATEAPIPTEEPEPPPLRAGLAFTVDCDEDAAVSDTSPAPAATTPPAAIVAVVVMLAMFRASEPARPSVPPPAPDFASAPNVFWPPPAIDASRETPFPPAVPAIDASFETFASVIATPAAIAAAPALLAVPSALVEAAACSWDFSERRPPAETVTPAGIVAFAETFAIVIATAAATLTPPPEVEALGVVVEPEPAPPLAAAVLSAWLRSPAT